MKKKEQKLNSNTKIPKYYQLPFIFCLWLLSLGFPIFFQADASDIYLQVSQTPECPATGCIGDDTRGDSIIAADLPYMITPRAPTRLLSDKPILQWNAVSDATSYTVSIRKKDGTNWTQVWQKSVTETEIVYPGEPALEPGGIYLISVKTDNHKSSSEEEFKLLTQDEAQGVRLAAEKIEKELDNDEKVMALVRLYLEHDLISEAIELLEASVSQGSQTASIYRTLGNLYLRVGLLQMAESPYLKAANLASQNGDAEGLAATLKMSNALADWYLKNQRYSQTEQFLLPIVKLAKDDLIKHRTLTNLGIAFSGLNRYEEAKTYLNQAIQLGNSLNLGKEQADAHCLLAEVLNKLEDAAGASRQDTICRQYYSTSSSL